MPPCVTSSKGSSLLGQRLGLLVDTTVAFKSKPGQGSWLREVKAYGKGGVGSVQFAGDAPATSDANALVVLDQPLTEGSLPIV